jgi:hypothetical protein
LSPRAQTRFFFLMVGLFAAVFAAGRLGSQVLLTGSLIAIALVFLSHIRLADTSTRFHGPIWLRRAQWAAAGSILLVAVLLGRVL